MFLFTCLYKFIETIKMVTIFLFSVRQKFRPKIKIKHKKLSSNEDLEATCHSSPAYPAPHLTWLINNVKVSIYLHNYLLKWGTAGNVLFKI